MVFLFPQILGYNTCFPAQLTVGTHEKISIK